MPLTPVATAPREAPEELGTPLSQVTFVVLDLETTGGSPRGDAITEVGALKLRGGELLGQFETLVNPGVPIPRMITVLTGITEAMVFPAPLVGAILPALLEFLGEGVIVGHNIRFDCAFLDAALRAHGYPALSNRRVDTLAIARRLIRDEVPNLRLQTLAAHLRSSVQPAHRAYADAAATAEVLHSLLERAGTFGVLALDDLLTLPRLRAHPSAAKLALTAQVPRVPGVYLFRDRSGRVLYVGRATNLRARVRSYFSSDHCPTKLDVRQLLRETVRIDHRVCAGPLEAAVRELRLLQQLQPRFNRGAKAWQRYTYLKLTADRFPRLVVTRTLRADGGRYLGPFPTAGAAQVVRGAIESVVPRRRCPGPVADDDDGDVYVDRIRRAFDREPALLLTPLEARMARLVVAERFEEAAATRDGIGSLARALLRRRSVDALRGTDRIVLATDEGRVELRYGRLVLAGDPIPDELRAPDVSLPPARDEIDELLVVGRWLRRQGGQCALLHASDGFASQCARSTAP